MLVKSLRIDSNGGVKTRRFLLAVSLALLFVFSGGLLSGGEIDLSGSHRFHAGDSMEWKEKDFDDSNWQRIQVPGSWQKNGISSGTLIGWYRIRFKIPEGELPRSPLVRMGRLGACADEVYLNGKKIGGMGSLDDDWFEVLSQGRTYRIAEEVWDRENVLAIRIGRLGDLGGIVEGPIEVISDEAINGNQRGIDSWMKQFEISALLALLLGAGVGLVMNLVMGWSRERVWFTVMFLVALASMTGSSYLARDFEWDGHFFYTRIGGGMSSFLLPVTFLYLRELLGFKWRRWHWGMTGLFGGVGVILLVAPNLFHPILGYSKMTRWTIGVMDLVTVLLLAEVFWHLLKALKRGEPGAFFVASGVVMVLIVFAVCYGEFLRVIGLPVAADPILSYGSVIGFVLCQVAAMGMRYIAASERVVALSAKLVAAQEEERKRLARDLHDGVAQSLQGIRLKAQIFGRDENRSDEFNELAEDLGKTVNDLRGVAHELRPDYMENATLAGAMDWYVKQMYQEVEVEIEVEEGVDLNAIAVKTRENLFRIFQEALSNAVRHGGASKFEVDFEMVTRKSMVMICKDNGSGFSIEDIDGESGIGLSSMRERAELMGGSFEVSERSHGVGSVVRVVFPVAE